MAKMRSRNSSKACPRAFAAANSRSLFSSSNLDLSETTLVMRGLDPRIHLLEKMMDCRVKPGNDEFNLRLQRFQESHRLALRRRRQFTLPHHPLSAHKRADRPALDLHAIIRRPACARGIVL